MMMDSYLYLAVVLLVVGTINGRAIDDIDNSIITSNNNNDEKLFVDNDWVEITLAPPPKIIQQPGKSVELECEVIGKPQPTIHWVRGNNPHNIIDNLDSNMISEINGNAMVRIRSRLIIEHSSASERTFTCVASAGGKTAYESTTIFSAPGHKSHNITELLSMNSGAKKARIVFYYSALFDTIGSNIVLPCKAAGRPNPEIYWLDNDNNIISGQDHRFRVHSSGSLYISSLRWADMGVYTCIAKNALDKDSISTFVYPSLNGDLD